MEIDCRENSSSLDHSPSASFGASAAVVGKQSSLESFP